MGRMTQPLPFGTDAKGGTEGPIKTGPSLPPSRSACAAAATAKTCVTELLLAPPSASRARTSQWPSGGWGVQAGVRESPGRPPRAGRQPQPPAPPSEVPGTIALPPARRPPLPPRRCLGRPAAPRLGYPRKGYEGGTRNRGEGSRPAGITRKLEFGSHKMSRRPKLSTSGSRELGDSSRDRRWCTKRQTLCGWPRIGEEGTPCEQTAPGWEMGGWERRAPGKPRGGGPAATST